MKQPLILNTGTTGAIWGSRDIAGNIRRWYVKPAGHVQEQCMDRDDYDDRSL